MREKESLSRAFSPQAKCEAIVEKTNIILMIIHAVENSEDNP